MRRNFTTISPPGRPQETQEPCALPAQRLESLLRPESTPTQVIVDNMSGFVEEDFHRETGFEIHAITTLVHRTANGFPPLSHNVKSQKRGSPARTITCADPPESIQHGIQASDRHPQIPAVPHSFKADAEINPGKQIEELRDRPGMKIGRLEKDTQAGSQLKISLPTRGIGIIGIVWITSAMA